MNEIEGEGVPMWIVNNYGELGVKVNGRFFFLYKGRNFEYDDKCPDDDEFPRKYRKVGKREFGEVQHPHEWVKNCRIPPGEYKDDVDTIDGSPLPLDYKWKLLPLAKYIPWDKEEKRKYNWLRLRWNRFLWSLYVK